MTPSTSDRSAQPQEYRDFGKVLLESEFDVPTRTVEGEPLPKERVHRGDRDGGIDSLTPAIFCP
jgi:hypothetical protein